MAAKKPAAPVADRTPREVLDEAMAALVSASRAVAGENQLDVGNYRLQFSGGELLSLSHK